ncbi:MAG: hypothetical protein ABR905_15065 [Terracidiphilus sp.]
MANTFTREDAKTCFGCDQKPPSFRLISLERFPNQSRELEPDCMTGLFCETCLKLEINEYFAAFAQNNIPLGSDESTERCLCRQVGFAVVPLMFSREEAKLLIDELDTDWLASAVN